MTLLALWHFLTGLVWILTLGAIVSSVLIVQRVEPGDEQYPGQFALYFLLMSLLMLLSAALFFVVGYGLWRLRRWGCILTIALAVLGFLIFLYGFFELTTCVARDVITRFDSFLFLLSLPYDLASWPFVEGVIYFFPSVEAYVGRETRYLVAAAGTACIAWYMLCAHVKGAFTMPL
ncbi:MAG: hypothetical protein HYY26_07215 [Acidobacteria bacterium]|nr:hypothetical protein [Acidobacteriota bacterium]